MLIKPADVVKEIFEDRSKTENIIVIFYLDINKNIISTHKKKYLKNYNLKISNAFIPAFYLGAKFLVVANIVPNKKNIKPTKLEIKLVRKIFSAGCFLNIYLLDYLLINKSSYYSFHESKII